MNKTHWDVPWSENNQLHDVFRSHHTMTCFIPSFVTEIQDFGRVFRRKCRVWRVFRLYTAARVRSLTAECIFASLLIDWFNFYLFFNRQNIYRCTVVHSKKHLWKHFTLRTHYATTQAWRTLRYSTPLPSWESKSSVRCVSWWRIAVVLCVISSWTEWSCCCCL